MTLSTPEPRPLPLETASRRAVLFLLITMPLIFGAVHPFVQGLYTFFILVGAGGWWIFVGSRPELESSRRHRHPRKDRRRASLPEPESPNPESAESAANTARNRHLWLAGAGLLLIYIGLTTIPLPLAVLGWLSPERARNLEAVNRLAGAGIEYAPLSYSALLTFKQGLFYLGLLFYFFSLRKLLRRSPGFALQIAAAIVAVGFFEALYGLLQVTNSSLGVLWLPSSLGAEGVARGTIIYRNQYATLLNMCWPPALAVAALNKKKYPAPLFLFAAGMIILALVFSLSRGGIIAFLCISVLMAAAMPFTRRHKALAVLLLGLFLALYGTLLGGFGELLQRFGDFSAGAAGRLSVWRMSLPMLADHPATGIGLESYVKLSPIYLKNMPVNLEWDRAHNEFLELAIELGIPAMLLFCALLFGGLSTLGRGLWRKTRRPLLGIAAFAGVVSFFIHGVTDFGWHLPANCVYCATLVAVLTVELDNRKRAQAGTGAHAAG